MKMETYQIIYVCLKIKHYNICAHLYDALFVRVGYDSFRYAKHLSHEFV